jgi:hypothetical protein
MAGLQRQRPFEDEVESVDFVDLLADLAKAVRGRRPGPLDDRGPTSP